MGLGVAAGVVGVGVAFAAFFTGRARRTSGWAVGDAGEVWAGWAAVAEGEPFGCAGAAGSCAKAEEAQTRRTRGNFFMGANNLSHSRGFSWEQVDG